MGCNRREFIVLTVGAVAGCAVGAHAAEDAGETIVDAGLASDYSAEGLYEQFRTDGFFIVRKGGKLMVLSSFCTHRRCMLSSESNHTFHCKCHGSAFDPSGHVTEGPAAKDLPVVPSSMDGKGHLIVRVPAAG